MIIAPDALPTPPARLSEDQIQFIPKSNSHISPTRQIRLFSYVDSPAIGHHMYDAEGQRRRRALLVSPRRWIGEADVLLCPSPASTEGSGADVLYYLGASGRLALLFPSASPEVGGADVLTLILGGDTHTDGL
jgi:hypothetical protein